MLYKSTRGNQEIVSGAQAILSGIAKDGGLFIMKDADFSAFDWKKLLPMTSLQMSEAILSFFFSSCPHFSNSFSYRSLKKPFPS